MKKQTMNKFLGLALGLALAAVFCGAGANQVSAAELNGKLSVSGEGAVTADPDIAYLNLGISTMEPDAKTAQQKNDEQMNGLIVALKELGIADKDLTTSNYYIYPERDYANGNEISGYVVNNSLSVTVRNLDIVGEVLDTCISEGANTGSGIEFSIEDSSKYYEQALTLAIANANAKGLVMAQALGVTIGAPIEVSESSRLSVMPVTGNMKAEAVRDTGSGSVPVESGSLVIRASIDATYAY